MALQCAGKTIATTLLAIIGVPVIGWLVLWPHIIASWHYGSVTPAEFEQFLVPRLTGLNGGIVVRVADGGTTKARRSDVTSFGQPTCDRQSACEGRRCSDVRVEFLCAFPVTFRDGSAGHGFLQLASNRAWRPGVTIPGSEPKFAADEPGGDEIADTFCRHGGGCPTAAPRVVPQTPMKAAPASATCPAQRYASPGGEALCLDAADPARRVFIDCAGAFCAPPMVALPPGTYQRGSTPEEAARQDADDGRPGAGNFARELPRHTVTIGYPLAVGQFEIRAADWKACMDDGDCAAPGDFLDPQGRRPVSGVSWDEITTRYLPWLNRKLGLSADNGYRLLTDAEWEYAARAGTTTRFFNGDLLSTRQARFLSAEAMPAGSFPPNAFGLHDMHGNVGEWVRDCTAAGHAATPRDGQAHEEPGCRSRIRRDASWSSTPWRMRSASRVAAPTDERLQTGFRIARRLIPME
jgi:formylglycine-generating enzyme required for sulfatase activity